MSTPTPTTASAPTKTPTPILAPSFDKNRGNNYIAAKYAQQLMDTANRVKANMVLDAYMRLDPEEIGNQSEGSYRNSVKIAVLAMKFDSSVWNIFNENTKRSLVTTYLKYPLGIFAANTVGLTIIDSNEVIMAKGTYDKREDQVNITVLN